MGIEYLAAIAEEDYDAFKMLVSTPLPREYDMWPPSVLDDYAINFATFQLAADHFGLVFL
jgi:hypothetical protein